MTNLVKITTQIREAMKQSCDDTSDFIDEGARRFSAEYLLTVNVAKSLKKLNGWFGEPYKIYLERSAAMFADQCLKRIILGNPMLGRKTIRRTEHAKISRTGRIDVAVYELGALRELKPICAIEVKGFNPGRTLVIKDLRRNLEYIRLSGNTGPSVIEFSCFAALHSFNHVGVSDVGANLQLLERKYKRWLAELGKIDDVETVIECFTVSHEPDGTVYDEGDYQTIDRTTAHYFAGCLVLFKARKV